jgi:uncharacterized delta-60 repeat protein
VAWGRHKNRVGPAAVALLLALVAWMAVGAPAGAEDASEATTFGADGVATQSLGIHLETTKISSVVAKPDGGLLAQQANRVEAFLPDGSPDPSFAPIATGGEGGGLFPAAEGKAFVLDEEELTRLNPDGTVDATFGSAGTAKVLYDAVAAGSLGSGKAVVIYRVRIGARNPNYDVGVTVLGGDGSSEGPAVRVGPISPEYYGGKFVVEVIPAPDGGGLVVGANFLLRLGPDGVPDRGFGRRGLLTPGANIAGAHFLPGGQIEVAGSGSVGKKSGPAILRFTATGKPDRSFATDGVRFYDVPGAVNVASWGSDGSVILGGREEDTSSCAEQEAKNCNETPVLVALDAAGNPVGSFGEGGVLRLSRLSGRPGTDGYTSEGVIALTRRPDGSVVAVGNAPPNESVGFLAALSPQSSLLPSFGGGGIVRSPEPVPALERVYGFVPLPGGRVLAAAMTDVGTEERAVLVRYDSDGSLDSSFGAGSGFVDLAGGGRQSTRPVLRGGKVLVAPYTFPHPTVQMAEAEDGSPVTSFNPNGTVHLQNREGYVVAVEYSSDGDPVVLGHHPSGGAGGPIPVQRFHPDGSPDRAFGHGRVLLRPPVGDLQATALAAAPGGRMLVGGFAGNGFVVGCLLPDGKPDPRFGSHGWATLQVHGSLNSMAMTRVGAHTLLAGVVEGARPHVVLLRLDARGHRDRGFGRGGLLSAPTGSRDEATTLLATPAGPVVLLERSAEPIVAFSPGGPPHHLPIGAHEGNVFAVQGTVSEGRLIVGWSPEEEGAPFHLSAIPLAP